MQKKILLIEDNADIRENMAEILSLADYQVFAVQDGKEGISTALKEMPDLILCDIMMPVLDGYGVLHMVQKNPVLQDTPFIFLTARSERNEIRRGMELGADDYITKPFDGTELLSAVDMRLRKADRLKRPATSILQTSDESCAISSGKDLLLELAGCGNLNRYKKKQIVYWEGSHPTRLFYVQKGKVKTFKRNNDGKEFITGLFRDGDFVGYTPLMEDTMYRETAETLEDTELVAIPRSEFEILLADNPALMKRFVCMLAQNIDEKEEQLLSVAYNSMRKKVADTLIMLCNKYNPENNPDFQIDLSRENMAAIVGVAKESLIRMLSELKDENLIGLQGSKIKVLDYLALKQMFN
ncbi:response regulator [Taibaiella soli]|uniref:Transcriptional regulator n=1 Tax=Taibaiella soli TaxID=1649169 RepID=A0A2W2AMU4_9BACT|nr:response regulator [Taibaiella soli]PZF74862.1 transcriptional regulator [Taibaiella soli]